MGLNTDGLKKKAEAAKTGDSLFFKLEEGKRNVVRILPRSLDFFQKDGDNDFAFTYFVHYRLFDVDGFRRIVCKQTAGQKCPICDFAASFEDKKKAKMYTPSLVHLYNVLDYDSARVKPFETGPFIYDEILKFVVDPSWGDSLFDIKTGRDVIINKDVVPASKRGQVNPYSITPTPDRTDVTELLPEKWDEIIDKLQERIPKTEDDAYYLSIVEHLRKGTAPVAVKKADGKEAAAPVAAPAASGSAAPAPAPVAAAPAATENPKCFGLEYSPRLDKCKTCPVKANCRDATLKL